MTKAPFSKKGERASDLLGLIHTDVCGPMSTCAINGCSYFITFTDDFSRYDYVYLVRHKSESLDEFKEFKTKVENQLNKSIKALRLDRRGEYLCFEFKAYLKECEIVSQTHTSRDTAMLRYCQEKEPNHVGHDLFHDE